MFSFLPYFFSQRVKVSSAKQYADFFPQSLKAIEYANEMKDDDRSLSSVAAAGSIQSLSDLTE